MHFCDIRRYFRLVILEPLPIYLLERACSNFQATDIRTRYGQYHGLERYFYYGRGYGTFVNSSSMLCYYDDGTAMPLRIGPIYGIKNMKLYTRPYIVSKCTYTVWRVKGMPFYFLIGVYVTYHDICELCVNIDVPV